MVYSSLSHLNNCGQSLALPQARSCGHLQLWHCIDAGSCDPSISLMFSAMVECADMVGSPTGLVVK